MIAIVDYGASNLLSVTNAVVNLGYRPKVTSAVEDVLRADAVLLPGVGAAADALKKLRALGMAEAIAEVVGRGRPFLGICLGYQLLFSFTEEGGAECLGILPGRVVRLPGTLKVPHIGWNQVAQRIRHPVFDGIPDGSNFYFVHSYYPDVVDGSLVAGETEYGVVFASVVVRGNLIATQFHPEKSGDTGLLFLDNFFRFAGIRP
ncbi:MAG: imidazole glycerol phosphate synthase subunit HisH [Dehalococcoidia bacterium]|nr:imidazole glycerol phosphate synthase subunit HisH [Dehalococcoidia bacterium]